MRALLLACLALGDERLQLRLREILEPARQLCLQRVCLTLQVPVPMVRVQMLADPGHHFLELKRLFDIVDRPQFQAAYFVVDVTAG